MKKILKSLLGVILTFIIAFNPILSVLASNNEEQIKNVGGETSNKNDGITISKTISSSELENYFDITLKVQTQEIAKEQDVDIVIVMDISRSMVQFKVDNTGITRLQSAVNAGEQFIKDFASYSATTSSNRKIGFVDFNTNAYKIFDLQKCDSETKANDLIKTMRTTTNNKVFNLMESGSPSKDSEDPYFMDSKHTRFTNIEAGLKLAGDMLKNSTSEHKFIILLSDGFPSTYMNGKGYNGYDPYTPNAKDSTTGQFYDKVIKNKKGTLGRPCSYGTDYSEIGARRAQELATTLKNQDGIKIYSVGSGIDAEAKTVDDYANQSYDHRYKNNFSTVDRIDTDYAIGHSLQEFKKWLGGTNNPEKPGIGSGYDQGYYFDTTDSASLNNAYKKIFEDIKKLTEASWVADDPMNSDNVDVKDVIEFVGIYDNNRKLYDSVNYDSKVSNNTSDNTASYNKTTDRINWNLKESKYIKTISGNKTYYNYEIKYRVRLKTEVNNFKSEKNLKTNGATTLSYVIKETGKAPRLKTLQFKVPEVKGYLGTLTFNKLTGYNNSPLGGTTFELEHSDKCECMNERKHMNANFKLTSISNSNGKVTFNNIPSGHTYKLKELKTDDYHTLNETIYDVKVSYGKTTHNIENSTVINNINTKDLVIVKEVKNITTNKSFDFEINATYKEEKLNRTYKVIRTTNGKDTNEEITFVDGVATFKLKHNESITIKDLPIKINFNIKELNIDGFNVKYQVNDGDIKKFNDKELENNTLEDNIKIKFINSSGYVMPGTGSSGMLILAIIGTLLLLIPILYISVNILKKD